MNGGFNKARGYAGEAPGQDLGAVLGRLTLKDLQLIVGERVLPLLPGGKQCSRETLVVAASRKLSNDPQHILTDSVHRKAILRNLDSGKLDELKHRLSLAGVSSDALEKNPELIPGALGVISGFLGLGQNEASAVPVALPATQLSVGYGLFAHQRSVVRRAHARVGQGFGRTLIHMPTGAGKTRTAVHLISRLMNEFEPCAIIWLASSRELLEQAAETFEAAWPALGNRNVSINRFWGDYPDPPEDFQDGLLVAGLAKMHSWRNRQRSAFVRLAAKTRLVVVDEAHQAIAPTYRSVIEAAAETGQVGAILGLTATPGRTWNNIAEDGLLAEFFENSKVVLEVDGYDNPVEFLLAEGYLARPTFSRIVYPTEEGGGDESAARVLPGDDFSEEFLERLSLDVGRNLSIIEEVRGLVSRGHTRIIVFAASVQNSNDLAAAFVAHGIDSVAVSADTPAARRASALHRFRSSAAGAIVLCNFGVLTTGFDAPKTSAAVIARPTKSLVLFSQMLGRATRGVKAGGNSQCEILTVHDPSCPGFGDIAEAFFNWEDVWDDN